MSKLQVTNLSPDCPVNEQSKELVSEICLCSIAEPPCTDNGSRALKIPLNLFLIPRSLVEVAQQRLQTGNVFVGFFSPHPPF